jgi:hypothetical protein
LSGSTPYLSLCERTQEKTPVPGLMFDNHNNVNKGTLLLREVSLFMYVCTGILIGLQKQYKTKIKLRGLIHTQKSDKFANILDSYLTFLDA